MATRPGPISLNVDPVPLEQEPPSRSAPERLMRHFEEHEQQELDFLNEYKGVIEAQGNPAIRFLLQLVIADEEKHHDMIRSMASALNAGLNWKKPPETISSLGNISDEEKENLLELTGKFIEEEKNGIAEYEALIQESGGYYQGLFELFIQTIIHDSKKHLMILEFLDGRLKDNG